MLRCVRVGHLVLLVAALVHVGSAIASPLPPPPIDIPQPATLDHVDPAVARLVRDALTLTQQHPDDIQAWMLLAMAYHANEFYQLADECYHQVVTFNDQHSKAWHMIGLLAVRDGRHDDALQAFAHVQTQQPQFAAGFWRAGFVYLERGELDHAADLFRQAAKLDPTDPTPVAGLARALMDQGHEQEAADILTPWMEKPTSQRGYLRFLLATADRRLGKRAEAERLLIGAQPGDVRRIDAWEAELGRYQVGLGAQLKLASRLFDDDKFTDAARVLEALRREHPQDPAVLTILGAAYRQLGRLDESETLLRGVLKREPANFSARYNLAILLAQKGAGPNGAAQRAEATGLIDSVIADVPDHAQALALRGDLYRSNHQLPEALETYQHALRSEPNDPRLVYRTGVALLELQQWSEAASVFADLCTLTPANSEAHRALATAQINLREFAAADAELKIASTLKPGDPRIAATRGLLDRARAQSSEAPIGP